MLQQLVEAGALRNSWSRPLEVHLNQCSSCRGGRRPRSAMEMLSVFLRKVLSLQDKGRLPVTAAETLLALTDAVIEDLQTLDLHVEWRARSRREAA